METSSASTGGSAAVSARADALPTDTNPTAPAATGPAATGPAATGIAPTGAKLRDAGLRATPQRLAVGGLLFGGQDRHVTAEMLHDEARAQDLKVSLATIYNTLHQFTEAGLLRQVVIDSNRSYFDTNVSKHHHFYLEDENRLSDIPGGRVRVLLDDDDPFAAAGPNGSEVVDVDVVVRVRQRAPK